jgi:hypothetical protein
LPIRSSLDGDLEHHPGVAEHLGKAAIEKDVGIGVG